MATPSENPTYKLSYFDIKALAEPIRMLFAYGDIKYEDVRVSSEDWPALKSSMPMGQMPVLEVDGIKVHQSMAICRYLAKRVGLAGTNDWESLLIDIAADTVNDLRAKIGAVNYEQDEAAKEKKKATLESETLPFYLDKLEEIVNENNGYLAIGQLSWADLYFAGIIDYINFMLKKDIFEKYPGLQKWINNVTEVESIKAWIAKRPVTDL